MLVSTARVRTDRPGRYLGQLCKHFAHKVPAQWDQTRGRADFAWGTGLLEAGDGVLLLRAEAPDAESLGRVEYVLGDHTERFGAREGLTVAWIRDDGPA